jgi:HK97 family phage major capsid protein
MPTITDLVNEVQTLSHDLSNRVSVLDKEQKSLREDLTSKTGAMPAEYKTAIDGLNNRINELMDQINKERIAAARPPMAQEKKDSEGRRAFVRAMKARGDLNLLSPEEKAHIVYQYMPEERKALYAGDATTGGFFATTDFQDELLAYRLLISNMRKICRVQKTSGEKVQMPALANDSTVYWATEQSSYVDSQDPTLSMINIPVHEMRGLLKISQQNLEDSMFNLEDFIKDRLTKQFAKKEGGAFINGDGNGKPRGILNYPIKASSSYPGGSAGKNNVTDAIAYVPSGSASTITADSILNVAMDLKADYDANSTYVFTRGTLNLIRLFKDNQARPLWTPFANGDLAGPGNIYGRPYVEMPDMPEVGTNAYPIIVGDFSNYMIVDRVTLNMQQLNELFAVAGLVGFIARIRVGGDLLLPEAFRVLKCATS